jgi:hypothetical protein
MTTFDKREASFEAAFAHDEELRFRALARRDRGVGLWAAEKLGKSGAAAADYAAALVAADVAQGGEDPIIARLSADFEGAGLSVSSSDIRSKMTEFLAKAVADLKAGR